MLQVFYLDVTKVDRVLHILQYDPLAVVVRAPCMHVRSGGMKHGKAAGAGSGGGWRQWRGWSLPVRVAERS
jgi:hypothetical protein